MHLYDYEREHLERLREGLAECTVLLKKNGAFPLERPCRLAVYGSGVRGTVKGGSGSGEVNSRYFVNVEQGLEDAGFTITTKDWLDAYDKVCFKAREAFYREIKARARKKHTLALIEGMGAVMPTPEYEISLESEAEAAIYVVSRISGEGNDRRPEPGDVLLTRSEQRDILELNKRYEKFMLVLNVGGPVDLTPVAEVGNILILSQLGVETGGALAELLLGKTEPSGKLTTTWAGWQDYSSIGSFGEKDNTDYKEGIYVGYRYFDSIGKPALFPFGHGLGYTDFSLSGEEVSVDGEIITLRLSVANMGKYAGKETVQLYVSAPLGELDKPYQELARINIGTLKKGGIQSIIGNASDTVPGAAGESTSSLEERGLPRMVMADGPAGLRLSPKYYRDKKGIHTFEATVPDSVLEYLPGPLAWFLGRKPKVKSGVEIQEQYTTAIPIGTAIAQSWNEELAYLCGKIVAEEMERFGVHLWLAPALNIHRSILCGRNFEYFSEDPLLSGRFAAMITKGVQSHPGCGVTIKHFAANNQETNRYNNSSNVSERAMREIYLKGFRICVEEAMPCAVMTSYNLLNGVHTSESRALTEEILRREWGFEGIVMTDWITAGFILSRGAHYAPPHAGKVAAAGSDLFMPGSRKDYKEVLEALKDGDLTREQLEISATRVWKMAVRLSRREKK